MIRRLCILLIIAGALASTIHAQDKDTPQPKLLSAPSPVYPAEARDAGIGGRVVAKVVVDANGVVLSVTDPIGPASELCDSGANDRRVLAMRDSVVEALKQAKFEPAMKDGKPVKSSINLGITFDPTEPVVGQTEGRVVKSGMITRKAVSMPKPEYPNAARAKRAAGPVSVQVVVDETGKVFLAEPVSGHPLLRQSAVTSACKAKFSPTIIEGKAVRVSGVITYNFVP